MKFRALSDAEMLALQKKKREPKIELTPEQKLNSILRKLDSKNIHVRKYHFKLIDSGDSLHLYTGSKEFIEIYERNMNGIRDAREISRNIFLAVKKEFRQGGYKFDLIVDNRQVDLSLGFSF